MEIQFCISGSTVFTTSSSAVPSIGAEVTICMESYKKGMWPGTILNFKVSEEFPPHFDYVAGVIHIDVNGWSVLKEGAEPQKE
ncbi:hypothetical protein J4E08_04275 [Sagittula sp. NFXS13]|uniref:hypothetical protein n=1 Tax=Sagittula sp. NFXS13 TaxID=2819095 RepID=UPI0032DE6360